MAKILYLTVLVGLFSPLTKAHWPSKKLRQKEIPKQGQTRQVAQMGNVNILASINPANKWYRGNTHAHTILSGHGDSAPEVVTKWYIDHGYHFLVLSEHNRFIDPHKVKLPKNVRKNFILIPGVEITGQKFVHATAMNVSAVIPWDYSKLSPSEMIQKFIKSTESEGGEMILNHPNWQWAVSLDEMTKVADLKMFELFNGHPSANNFGNGHLPSTEEMWDALLTSGQKIYGVSSDDSHMFKKRSKKLTNPGRGWVMVNAPTLEAKSITDAMARGDFYSSNGVFLKELVVKDDFLFVNVDFKRTLQEVSRKWITGNDPGKYPLGFTIEFIGPGKNNVIQTSTGPEASFKLRKDLSYIRAKIIYVTKALGKKEAFYAWTNPFF